MTYRAKIEGPSVTSSFGVDIFEIANPDSVQDIDGVLVVTTLPTPAVPAAEVLGRRYAARKATHGSQVCYPRGGWTKVTITDYVDDVDED